MHLRNTSRIVHAALKAPKKFRICFSRGFHIENGALKKLYTRDYISSCHEVCPYRDILVCQRATGPDWTRHLNYFRCCCCRFIVVSINTVKSNRFFRHFPNHFLRCIYTDTSVSTKSTPPYMTYLNCRRATKEYSSTIDIHIRLIHALKHLSSSRLVFQAV